MFSLQIDNILDKSLNLNLDKKNNIQWQVTCCTKTFQNVYRSSPQINLQK